MCGICGIVALEKQQPIDKDVLGSMMQCIAHRGPNDDGSYTDNGIGLGFRRLSIVDIGGGHQPMTNEAKSIWLTFNGEIYNHQTLRAELESQGHLYSTRSDTESIVHLYEEHGLDCFAKTPRDVCNRLMGQPETALCFGEGPFRN